MTEHRHTGGTKTFSYSKEDAERIRKTDTSSTRAFKEAYAEYQTKRKAEQKIEDEFRRQQRRLVAALLVVLGLLAALLVLRFFA
jgi:ferric-dicitrate binding protein FerR (iron transport regulator)